MLDVYYQIKCFNSYIQDIIPFIFPWMLKLKKKDKVC